MLLRWSESGSYTTLNGEPLTVSRIQQQLAQSADQELVVVVPAHLTIFSLSKVAAHELRHLSKTLPWRFEDQIVDSVERLHFAHTQINKTQLAVTAINSDQLEAIIVRLDNDGLQAKAVISELELVPWSSGSWTIFQSHSLTGQRQCLIRYGEHQGLVCSQDNLKRILQSLLNESDQLPKLIALYSDSDSTAALLDHIPENFQTLVKNHKAKLATPTLLSCCNLLQGRFAVPLPWGRWWQQWRLAAMLLLALLLGDIAITGASVWQIDNEIAELENQINESVQEVLPGAVIVNPLLQVRRAVAARGGNLSSGFLNLLTRMAPVLEGHDSLVVLSVDFRQNTGELQLLIQTENFASVEALRSQLQALGLSAELLGSNSDGTLSRSRLRIRS